MVYWLKPDDLKNRMFLLDKNNIIRYVLRHNRVGILHKDEEAFLEVLVAPRSFQSGKSKYPSYKMKAAVTWYDHKAKDWLIDDEVLVITLSAKDYNYFQAIKCRAGDRLRMSHYSWKTPKGFYGKGISWARVKKGGGSNGNKEISKS